MITGDYLPLISRSAFEDYVADFLGRIDMATIDLILKRHIVFKFDKTGFYIKSYVPMTKREKIWMAKVLDRYMKRHPFWECLLTSTEIN